VLAGLLSFGSVVTMLNIVLGWFHLTEPLWAPVESVVYLTAMLFGAYIFGFVALTGNSPRFIAYLKRDLKDFVKKSNDIESKNHDDAT
jgi:ribose/xylose/arabinose/galactoside ABC-type transport system permease subunit